MEPSRAWLGRFIMAGSCLAWAGCGGGGVPDPASDSSAAPEQPVKVVDKGAEPAPEPPAGPKAPDAPAKPEAEVKEAAAPSEVTQAPAPAVAEVQPGGDKPPGAPEGPMPGGDQGEKPGVIEGPAPVLAQGEKPGSGTSPEMLAPGSSPGDRPGAGPVAEVPGRSPADAAAMKGDASGTEEMMRIAASPGTGAPPTGDLTPPSASSLAPSSAPIPPVAPNTPGAPGPGSVIGPNRVEPPPSPPEGGGRPGFGGGGNVPGMAGNDAGAPQPGAFNRPGTAVDAFLKALKAKNKDRLADATARRSATEAVEKHRKIFAEIIEGSISDVELDEMASSMDGYQVMYELPAKSTGRVGVVISKTQGRDRLQRTVIARKEREGWKVMDIEGAYDFKPVGNYRRSGRR